MVPVNRGMSSRLSHASNEDANVNAVIILATQGTMVPNYIESSLSELEHIFSQYMPAKPGTPKP